MGLAVISALSKNTHEFEIGEPDDALIQTNHFPLIYLRQI